MSHPEGTTVARITELAQSFPSLNGVAAVTNWDADALDKWACSASHGERLAIQFVLCVWNQWEEWDCGRFDVIEAYGVWDTEHWAVFHVWSAAPFTL